MPRTAYSCYFELQLDLSDFGKIREEHFQKCNQVLLSQLLELGAKGRQFHPGQMHMCLKTAIEYFLSIF